MPHGPATRGSRWSSGLRSGLAGPGLVALGAHVSGSPTAAVATVERSCSQESMNLATPSCSSTAKTSAASMPTAASCGPRGVARGSGAGEAVVGDHPVRGDRVEGRLGHRVHAAGAHQLDDVAGRVVVGVLHAGRRPQRALGVRAAGSQGRPSVRGERLPVRLPDLASGRDRRPDRAGQRTSSVPMALEPGIHLGVDTADEEARDRVDPGEVVAADGRELQPGLVRLDDGEVPLDGEDQGDVDADPRPDDLRDRRQAREGRRDLDQRVGPVDDRPQLLGLGDGPVGVVGEPRVDLDRDPAVLAVGCRATRPRGRRRRTGRHRW